MTLNHVNMTNILFFFFACQGLAGVQPKTGDIFLKYKIDGTALSLLLREDLIRMGITSLDQQLILMQSIDLLLTLV